MEADGSSSSTCGYCQQTGHRTEECRERVSDRRFEIAGACLAGIVLVPALLLGTVLGAIWGALSAGFQVGFRYWPSWTQSICRPFRKDAP
jgi:hypothetical protein